MATMAADNHTSPTPWESAPATTPNLFFTLPPEIRDMIYQMLYGDVREVEVKTRASWTTWERIQRIQELGDHQLKPFPLSSLRDLIVSKEYFDEACRAWMRSKTFLFSGGNSITDFVDGRHPIHRYTLQFVTSLRTSNPYMTVPRLNLDRIPGLKYFSAAISCGMMTTVGSTAKLVGVDDLTDTEIASLTELGGLLQLRQLTGFTLSWSGLSGFSGTRNSPKWASFKTQVETLLNDVVTQPRETRSDEYEFLTLHDAFEKRANPCDSTSGSSTPDTPEPSSDVNPLQREDIPRAESALLRLCLTRPKALLKWIEDAADKQWED